MMNRYRALNVVIVGYCLLMLGLLTIIITGYFSFTGLDGLGVLPFFIVFFPIGIIILRYGISEHSKAWDAEFDARMKKKNM